MDLFFCDICNESVPQVDLDGGLARKVGERVVCTSCEQAMSPPENEPGADASLTESEGGIVFEQPGAALGDPATPTFGGTSADVGGVTGFQSPQGLIGSPGLTGTPPQKQAQPRSASQFLIGLIAFSALAASVFVIVEYGERIQTVRAANRSEVAGLERRLAASESRLRNDLEDKTSKQRTELRKHAADTRTDQSARRAELTKQIGAIRTKLEQIDVASNRLSKLETDARLSINQNAKLRGDLDDVNRQLNLLVERWTEAIATGDVAQPGQGVSELDAAPAWHAYTEKLSSPSADTRWTAVNAMGESKDDAVVPHLIKMLDDRDIFVRVATARIFGDLGSELAIGPLIDALDDETQSVREVVVESLRTITAQNFRFDPGAREADRERRIKAWRDWWKKQA